MQQRRSNVLHFNLHVRSAIKMGWCVSNHPGLFSSYPAGCLVFCLEIKEVSHGNTGCSLSSQRVHCCCFRSTSDQITLSNVHSSSLWRGGRGFICNQCLHTTSFRRLVLGRLIRAHVWFVSAEELEMPPRCLPGSCKHAHFMLMSLLIPIQAQSNVPGYCDSTSGVIKRLQQGNASMSKDGSIHHETQPMLQIEPTYPDDYHTVVGCSFPTRHWYDRCPRDV